MVRLRSSATVAPARAGATTGGPPMIAALTGIRGVAAAFVVLFHLRELMYGLLPSTYMLDGLLRYGYLGVDVFFVLSGFVISYNYADRMRELGWARCRSFFVARFARIYPVYFVTLLMTVALVVGLAAAGGVVDPNLQRTVPGLVGNVFLLQNLPGGVPWNGVSWSVSCEAMAYLVFPLAVPLVARLRWRAALVLAVGVALLQLAAIFTLPGLFPYTWVRIAGEFTLGCLLWATWRGRMRPGRGWDVVAVVATVLALVLFWRDQPWFTVPLIALAVAATSTSTSMVRTLLASRVMQWSGRVSYSLYLVHVPVIMTTWLVLPPARFGFDSHAVRIGVVVAYLAAMVVAAAALYYGVEEPARAWINRRAGLRKELVREPAVVVAAARETPPSTAADLLDAPSPHGR